MTEPGMAKLTRDHPLFFHVLVGASPWCAKGEASPSRYYVNHYRYRGWEWWDQTLSDKNRWISKWGEFYPGLTDDHLRYGMPEGYWDVAKERWCTSKKGTHCPWTEDFYDGFMRAALKRRTLAPMFPPKEVLTANGRIVQHGMLATLLGGAVLSRPDWDMTPNIGMTVLVMYRHAEWNYKTTGLRKSYGTGGLTLREYAYCLAPYAWWITPADEDREFIIPGRNIDCTRKTLPIENPAVSLLALDDDGSRALRKIFPTPDKEIAWA